MGPKIIENSGILFIVATPIGNLKDITLRALETLKESDLIAAEDTRDTIKLLNHFEITKKIISCNKDNEREVAEYIIKQLGAGLKISLVSSAGTPLVSDPGSFLLRRVCEDGFKIIPIPGVSALTTAISVFPDGKLPFLFTGFLPREEKRIEELCSELLNVDGTWIFYESPRRLVEALNIIKKILPEAQIMVGREMTKIFEEFISGTVTEVSELLKDKEIKGEVTAIIQLNSKRITRNLQDLDKLIENLRKTSLSLKDICSIIKDSFGLSKKTVYDYIISIEGNKN